MTIRASSRAAPGLTTPAGNGPGGQEQLAPAPAVATRAGLRRYAPRDLWALAAGNRAAGMLPYSLADASAPPPSSPRPRPPGQQ